MVLVHGGFVDGSGWRPVYDLLTQDGYHVAVVQNPTLSLPGDAAATRMIIDAQDGPVVLAGHSYGGAVGPQPPILPPRDGFLFLDRAKFHASFAADLPADLAAFMADSQVPWAVDAPAGQVTDPAWRTKPLVHGHDRGPDDPPGGPAHHVPADWGDHCRGGGESLRLRLAATRHRRPHQAGRTRGGRVLTRPSAASPRPQTRASAGGLVALA
jgi:pimeloyl-ACP methyl ester carboxylesterase